MKNPVFPKTIHDRPVFLAVAVLLISRVVFLLGSSPEMIRGYGDFYNFYQLAVLQGWPFFDYWVEYPPVFPFISEILVLISGGREHVFDISLFILLTVVDAGNIWLLTALLLIIQDKDWKNKLTIFLWLILVVPFYWWYFDSLAVFSLLLGVFLVFRQKYLLSGIIFGIGGLVKIIPLIGIIAVWQSCSWRRFLFIGSISVGLVGAVLFTLWLLSPINTTASLTSQGNKGSWSTVWAILDGNYRIGILNNLDDRFDPDKAHEFQGKPPRVSPLITAGIIGIIGIIGVLRKKSVRPDQALAMTGFCLVLLFVWFPGWSVQWVLYILPLVLLVFDLRQAIFFVLVVVLINIAEYPVLLTRGLYWTMPITAILRTYYWIRIAIIFYNKA